MPERERAQPLSHKREMKIRGVWNLHLSLDGRRGWWVRGGRERLDWNWCTVGTWSGAAFNFADWVHHYHRQLDYCVKVRCLLPSLFLPCSLSLSFLLLLHTYKIFGQKKRCSHNKNIGKLWRKLIDSHLSTSCCCCCCCCSCRLSIVGCACWRCFDCFVKLSKISKQLAAAVISCSFSLSISISCLDVVF